MMPSTIAVAYPHMLKVILSDANRAIERTGQLRTGATTLRTGRPLQTTRLYVSVGYVYRSSKYRLPRYTAIYAPQINGTVAKRMEPPFPLAGCLRIFRKDDSRNIFRTETRTGPSDRM